MGRGCSYREPHRTLYLGRLAGGWIWRGDLGDGNSSGGVAEVAEVAKVELR